MDKKLEKMAYFTTQDVAKLINPVSVDTLLRRELKKGTIFKLKRGFYISKEKWIELKINNETDQYLKFLTTNVLLSPSYISLEDVLFMNNVITENVYVTTAITTKKTNKFTNFLGTFSYRNIQPDLFRWYETKVRDGYTYFIAYPEKALLDYLWLKKDLVFEENYFEELRLEVGVLDFERLEQFVKRFNKKKMDKCFIFLKKLKWSQILWSRF